MIRIVTFQMLVLVHRTLSTYCGTPGHPSGGSVLLPRSESDRSRYFETGTVVKYSCNKGRIMFGTGVRECLENGSWSSTIPICKSSLSFNGSTLQSDTNSTFGSSFAVDGNTETCAVSSGNIRWWQVQIKQSLVQEIGLVLPVNSYQHFSIFVIQLLEGNQAMYKPCSSFKNITIDSYVVFKCDDVGLLGEFIYIRDERADKNEKFSLCEVQIFSNEDIECGHPDEIVMGTVKTFEGIANFDCDKGHYLAYGNKSMVCNKGEWVGITPICKEMRCSTPVAPTDGYIQIRNFTGVYRYGTVANFLCNPGYQLIGDQSSTCDGNWTGISPTCSPISCGYPPKLENGEQELLNSSTNLFSLAAYKCKGSFRFNTSSDKDLIFISQCLEDGNWSSLDISCVFDPSSLVFSDWPAITISILCIVIIILVVMICWRKGYTRCQPNKKPSFINKGVNAKAVIQSMIDTDLVNSATATNKYKSSLSTFNSSGSIVGIRYPLRDDELNKQQLPLQNKSKESEFAPVCGAGTDAVYQSSSERSSGDGEESLYATIRRKKSIQRNQNIDDGLHMLSESKLKAQPFIPELRDSLESEKQDIIGSNSEEPSDLKPPSDNLVKPSEIRKFVRSNSRCKIEL